MIAEVPKDVDADTRDWIRNQSDVLAVRNGCTFNVKRGLWTVWWIERYCKLYEGSAFAGKPLILRSCSECDHDWPIVDSADDQILLERVAKHLDCIKRGHRMDWQFDCFMRIFGWVRYSDHWRRNIRRFREASIWIAKKNAKSPSLAALGLYLTCGDGEPGQHVFFGAKDGTQARTIVGGHAVKMFEKSPELSAELTLNKNLMRLTHNGSDSFMEPMSSSNSRTQESKEGLNGSMLIDEVHVVDGDFMDRISRAGISRMEPLQGEFSTSGNNPDGYGKSRFDHAVSVEKGDIEDQALFVAVYAAPQNVTDAEIDSDPLKYGYMANPKMGTIVNREEFLDDYRRSRPQPAKFAKFKMYRLNIWQATSNPWLNQTAWANCYEAYDETFLKGRACVAGLDLSKTRDFTALAYAFPDANEVVRLFVRYFLPQDRAEEYKALPHYGEWLKSGNLIVTPGAVLDYGAVRAQFREDAKLFKVTNLMYDPWHAEETTQTISDGVYDPTKHQQIEEGTGVTRTIFRQVIGNFAEPVAEFERRVLNGKLRHNGNPILTWQAQHVHVKADYNGNIRPVKPTKGDMKTIDGIVASIMAFAGCKDLSVGSVYETRGMLRL